MPVRRLAISRHSNGRWSVFEVLLEAYNLTSDPALMLLGKIVGTADVKDSPWKQPEGPEPKAFTEGILDDTYDGCPRADDD
ncbi:MAG TPA: chromate resistance protein ChrB domain-containing protein [Ktedonobacterales bacterium]|nr:chromate resistance protein ChrB domain-containing protein [Ktedonobacterales bacterium]